MLGSLLKRTATRRVAAPVRAITRSLVTRSTARKSTTLAARPVTAAKRRILSTEAASAAAPAVKHLDEAVVSEDQGGLLNRGHELYPVVGLGLAAAITQEWWIMDEYWITGLCYGGVMYGAYLFGHDRLMKSGRDAWNRKLERTKSAFGVRLDILKRYAAMEDYALSFGEELRALYTQEAKVNAMSVEFRNLKLKFDTRAAVLSKLNSIKVLEDDARTQAIAALSKKAGEYVVGAYAQAPAAVKQKNIEAGIAAIAPELTTRSIALSRTKPPAPLAADDPVKMLFDEFLATPRTFAQLGVENYAAKFMDKDKPGH